MAQPAPIGTGDGSGDVDALENVALGSFTAAPTHIGPFDHSVLAWQVHGVVPRVRVLLDSAQVAAVGQAIVQPAVTASYTLSAQAGQARKTLGHATVSVDVSTCDEVELLNLLSNLREQVLIGVANHPGNYWSGDTTNDPNILSVVLTDEPIPRINIRAVFRQRIAWFPDPWVTLELSFGLAIAGGKFVAVAPSSVGTVEFDRVTWFLGGILLGLAQAINGADQRATQAGAQIIAGLLTYINVVALHPSPGKEARRAVVEHRDGRPFIGFVECATGSHGVTVILADLELAAALTSA